MAVQVGHQTVLPARPPRVRAECRDLRGQIVPGVLLMEMCIRDRIWHATENEILSRDYTAFNWDDWNALNPAGFTYWSDSGDYDRYDARWTMFDNGEGVYFVDSYAKLAAQEDRARIMEYFMVHEDEAGLLIQSDAIRQKLEWLCRAVRECFDTAGWETPRWEKLL